MSTRGLPNEIIERIIQLSSPSVVYQWIFVNKTWSTYATSLFYQEVELDEDKLNYVGVILQQNRKSLCPKQLFKHASHFVNKLTIHKDEGSPRISPGPFIAALVPYFSNLTIIDISSSADAQFYLFDGLLYSVQKENLKFIQQIKVFHETEVPIRREEANSPTMILNYFLTCYKFRDTLTHLELYDLEPTYHINEQSGNYLRFLPHFKRLTHLSIINNHYLLFENYGVDDELVMPLVLSVCPNLVSFTVKNSFTINSEYYSQYQQADRIKLNNRIEKEEAVRNASISASRPPAVIKTPLSFNVNGQQSYNIHLKNLVLVFPSLGPHQMDYIMSYIPTPQLDSLTLKLTRDATYEWIENNSQERTIKFAEHLSKVKNLEFGISNLATYRTNMGTTGTRQEKESKAMKFGQFVNGIMGDRELYLKSAFYVLKDNQMSYTRSMNSFNLKIQNHKDMYLDHVINHNYCSINNGGSLLSPFFLTTKTANNMMRGLKYLDMVVPECNPIQILTYALTNFPQLTTIKLRCNNDDVSYSFTATPTRGNNKPTTTTAIHNLTSLRVNNATIQTNSFHTINSLLPNIKVLSLEDCKFSRPSPYEQDSNAVLLNLKQFKNLKYFGLTFPFISRENSVFLQNEYVNDRGKEETACYKSHAVTENSFILVPMTGDDLDICLQDQELFIIESCNKLDIIVRRG